MIQDQQPSQPEHLRFPEFRDSGAWEVKRLEEVVLFLKGKTLSKIDIIEGGQYECIRYGELYTRYQEVINHVVSKTNLLPKDNITSLKNDILIPSSGETQTDIAKASSVQKNGVILGGDLNILRGAKNGPFLSYYINGSLRNKIARIAQGNSVVHLYSSQLKSLKISLPSPSEQKKIAECLSSLDEFITAQAERLDGLKDYKKGLMQQLFPNRGKTIPNHRFREFQGRDPWWEKRLDEVCSKITLGGTPDTSNSDYWNGSINWLTPAEMGKTDSRFMHETVRKITELGLKNCSSDLLPINSVIVSTRAPIGHLAISKSEMAINQGCKGLVPKKTTSHDFLYYFLLKSKFLLMDLGAGSTFKELTGSDLKKIKIPLPNLDEQKRIANCLSLLDEAITEQMQKVETLKNHKIGLMQQLFPRQRD